MTGKRIPDEAARAIWLRAAQLQAEAEHREEERSRQLPVETDGSVEAGGEDSETDGLRPDDLRTAAEEAGISPEFIQIALAEAGASSGSVSSMARWETRGSKLFLGATRSTIEVTTTIQGSVDVVAAACLQVFSGLPCQLQAGEVAELPSTAGRVLVLNVPKFDWGSTSNPPFSEKAVAIGLKQLHVAIRPLAGERATCEVVVAANLRPGMRTGWRWSAATSVSAGAFGGVLGAVAVSAFPGAVLALPAFVGGMALWIGSYRYYRAKVEEDLEESLALLPAAARGVAAQQMGRDAARGSLRPSEDRGLLSDPG